MKAKIYRSSELEPCILCGAYECTYDEEVCEACKKETKKEGVKQ